MPTMSPASMTSRKIIKSVASIPLQPLASLRDEGPLGLILVKIVKEAVSAGLQRPDIEADVAASRDDLLGLEAVTLELGRSRIEILDRELHALVGGNGQLLRREFVLLEAEFEGLIVGAQRGEARQERRDEDGEWKYVMHAGNL